MTDFGKGFIQVIIAASTNYHTEEQSLIDI